ncbi:MAG: Ankyrin repeat (many copies) [Bacteroidetes bacterium]|nr:Ankyrin repeat (many copies) [Bacteroidota bacterium]
MKYLLEKGANVNNVDKDNETPVMYCAQRGHVEVLKLLLTYKPDLTIRNNEKKNAAEIARDSGQPVIEKLLLDKMKEQKN